MSRYTMILIIMGLAVTFCLLGPDCSQAKKLEPEAPSTMSWFPHGFGGHMDLDNSYMRRRKVIHGLRMAPSHVGAIGQPMWGWDTNGFYRGPQELEPDPVDCQLPIGLIYPANGKALPPPKKVSKGRPAKVGPRGAPRRIVYPKGGRAVPGFRPVRRGPAHGPGYGPRPVNQAMAAPVLPMTGQRMAPVMGAPNYMAPGRPPLPPAQPVQFRPPMQRPY
jgi:hypothetical protein